MSDSFSQFESISRRANRHTSERSEPPGGLHPFDERNIHQRIQQVCLSLFDNGHYSQTTFEAYKFLDKEVQHHSSLKTIGQGLMMEAFNEDSPLIRLTPLTTISDKDEQRGFRFIFAGSVGAIRNPRGHEIIVDSPDKCLDHLSLASLLLRRLEEAGFKTTIIRS